MLCIELCPSKVKKILFAVFYKPPNFNDMFIDRYKSFIIAATNQVNMELVIMGDFNAYMLSTRRSKYVRQLIQASQCHGLFQLIDEPTRVTAYSSTTIDFEFYALNFYIRCFNVWN